RADEDDALHLRERREHRQARAGVAGARAGYLFRADDLRVRERGGHPVVFEAPGRIQPFILQAQRARPQVHLLGEQVGLLEDGASLADRDDLVFATVERQQLAEPPDAREIQAAGAADALGRPAVLEERQALRHRQLRPVVDDVEQAAALRAGDLHL